MAAKEVKSSDDWVDVDESEDWEDVGPDDIQETPSGLDKAVKFATTPLTDAPRKAGLKIADTIDDPNRDNSQENPLLRYGRSFLAGATEGVGNVLSEMTAPLDLATTLAGVKGVGTLAKGARAVGRVASAGTSLRGANRAVEGVKSGNLTDVGTGLLEGALGVAGASGKLGSSVKSLDEIGGSHTPKTPVKEAAKVAEKATEQAPLNDIETRAKKLVDSRKAKKIAAEMEAGTYVPESKRVAIPEDKPIDNVSAVRHQEPIAVNESPSIPLSRRVDNEFMPVGNEVEPIVDRRSPNPDANYEGLLRRWNDGEQLSSPDSRTPIDDESYKLIKDLQEEHNRTGYIGEHSSDRVLDESMVDIRDNAPKGRGGLKLVEKDINSEGQNDPIRLTRGSRNDVAQNPHQMDVDEIVSQPGPELEVLEGNEGINLNASGQTKASQEAINRKVELSNKGQKKVILDRAGNETILTDVDAIADPVVRKGQTLAIKNADGTYDILDNQGGKVPNAKKNPFAEKIEADKKNLSPIDTAKNLARTTAEDVDIAKLNLQRKKITQAEFDAIKTKAEIADKDYKSYFKGRDAAIPELDKGQGGKKSFLESLKSEEGSASIIRDDSDNVKKVIGIGRDKLNEGNTKYSDWSKAMVEEFGEDITPHLNSVWKKSSAAHREGLASENPLGSAVDALKSSLKGSKSVLGNQARILKEERAERFKNFDKASGEGTTWAKNAMGSLKGEYTNLGRKALRLDDNQVSELHSVIKGANITAPEKARAIVALGKTIKGELPQRNELALLGEIFGRDIPSQIIEMHGGLGLTGMNIEKLMNTAKNAKATLDFSGLRQASGLALTHPKEFMTAARDMFKYAADEKNFDSLMDNIRTDPDYLKSRDAGLFISKPSTLTNAEESFANNYIDDLPKGLRRPIDATNRAYTGLLNQIRYDVWKKLNAKAESAGIQMFSDEGIATQEGKDLAKVINTFSGRGTLGKLEKFGSELGLAFWSPRFVSSRLQALNPMYYANLSPFAQKEAIKNIAGLAGLTSGILTLMKASGASVSLDPSSADFLKGRWGDKVIDPLFGYQQPMVAFARSINELRRKGGNKSVGGYRSATGAEGLTGIGLDFTTNKLSPLPALGYDLYSSRSIGKDGTYKDRFNKEKNIGAEAGKAFLPFSVEALTDAMNDDPSVFDSLLYPASGVFGLSPQEYKAKGSEASSRRRLRIQ